MKLFIYYSLSGNLDYVSNTFKNKGYDVIKVVPEWKVPKNKFGLFMSGGFLAWIGKKMKLVNFNPDLTKYDQIVIASPIWNSRLSCPINTVLDKLDLSNKKVTIILSSASGKAKAAVKKLNKINSGWNIIILKEPKVNQEELNKLCDF